MRREKVLRYLKNEPIIAIVRRVSLEDIGYVAEALKRGGITNLEIALDHTSEKGIQNSLNGIAFLRKEWKEELNIGAGTILTEENVLRAAEAGADYMISPSVSSDVIRKTRSISKVSIPGALTPTEAVVAWQAGADIIKMFPAGILGIEYLKAVRAPLAHIPMCAVGGINPANIGTFLEAGIQSFGIGGNLVSKKAIAEKNYQELTETAKLYCDAIGQKSG